jgi:hypothetical protein
MCVCVCHMYAQRLELTHTLEGDPEIVIPRFQLSEMAQRLASGNIALACASTSI